MEVKNRFTIKFLIISIVVLIISISLFSFAVHTTYGYLINTIISTSQDYMKTSNKMMSISPDEPDNIDFAINTLEIIRSESNVNLIREFLNIDITLEDMEVTNKAYDYLVKNYDELKTNYTQDDELKIIAEELDKVYREGYMINLGDFIYGYNDNVFEQCYFLVIIFAMNASEPFNTLRSEYAEMLWGGLILWIMSKTTKYQ